MYMQDVVWYVPSVHPSVLRCLPMTAVRARQSLRLLHQCDQQKLSITYTVKPVFANHSHPGLPMNPTEKMAMKDFVARCNANNHQLISTVQLSEARTSRTMVKI